MKLVFLGTGGSYPTPQRNVPSVALKHKGDITLFDCGEGTQRQLMHSPLSFMKINRIFITHFHGDHFLGLPGLIQSMNMNDRERALEIYGPRGTVSLVKELAHIGYFKPNFPLNIVELKIGAELAFENYEIETVQPDHNVPSLTYCFKEKDKKGRFNKQKALDLGVPEGPLFSKIHSGNSVEVDEKEIKPEEIVGPPRQGRKIVYTGDTRPTCRIVEAARDADVLIHDATLDSSKSDRAVERGHSSVTGAAKVAKKARVDKLFLVHISPRYRDVGELEKQAKEVFSESTIPDDLVQYDIDI